MKHVLLVIDDDERMVSLISSICQKCLPEIRVITALDGKRGLQLARSETPGVVVLDVKLPDINGFEVCRRLRADPATINTHILMISGVLMEAKDRIHGIESGADNYLLKPFESEELVLQIKALFRWWDAEQTQREKLERLVEQQTKSLVEANAVLQKEIAERKQAQAEVNAITQRLRMILAQQHYGILVVDAESRIEYANDVFLNAFGLPFTPAELPGWTKANFLEKLLPACAEPPAMAALIDELVRRKQPILGKEVAMRDGRIMLADFIPLQSGGKPAGRMWIVRDITERKRAEAEMQRLAMAVEQAAETIVITDLQGTILYANPAFEKSTGYTRQEALGQNPRILKSGKQDAAFYKQMWGTLTRGDVWQGHFSNKHKGGALYEEEATISPVRDSSGTITNYVAIKLDVSRERQLEEQVQQAQKMESVGRLAGGVAHDFNNLLQSILGFAELLRAELPPGTRQHDDVQEIQNAAERAARLTRQLLAFSRRQMIIPTALDLNDLVSNMHKMLHRLLGEDIQLVTDLTSDLQRVKADSGQIEQIIMNLVINARDAMPHGGRITITTANVTLTPEDIQFHVGARTGHFVRLIVSDTGTGIEPEVLPHIFEPFFSTKGPGKGTGLGLSVIYGIAQQHNGWVNVYSEVGHGSAFKLYLPAFSGTDEAVPSPRPPPAPPRGHGERILLIEDEPEIRRLAERVLIAAGYAVVTAATANEGCTIFAKEDGCFDLVFSDVVLPDQNGIAIAEQFLEKKPSLAVLLCSGYTDDRSRWHAIAEKKYNFLQKPYPVLELLQTVHTILDARPPSKPAGR